MLFYFTYKPIYSAPYKDFGTILLDSDRYCKKICNKYNKILTKIFTLSDVYKHMNKILLLSLIAVVFLAGCAKTSQIETPTDEQETQQMPPEVTKSTEQQPIKEFALDVDENGFYPTERIAVRKGEIARIIFFVKSNVSPTGLSIKSDYFDSGVILPGQFDYVQFTATNSFEFTAYLSNTNIAKVSGQVIVI